MQIPATREETASLKWGSLDVIIVTGDALIDSPFIGAAVITRVLLKAGYRVAVISQPDLNSGNDITRFGEPKLFWGVTAGAVDSMVANYTALQKKIQVDDMTPGGDNDKRPDRATIAYTNLIKKYFKNTKPVILGGLEASLRRAAHYDYWSDRIRRSILFDAKADAIIYGMGEKAVLETAACLKNGESLWDVKGLCFADRDARPGYIELPSFEECSRDKNKFAEMFKALYDNTDPITAKGLCQKQDTRYLIQNPPQPNLSTAELDAVYELPFTREAHPSDLAKGEVRAQDTIKFSITSHRGCYGECNFCAITAHQGATVISRSEDSIVREAERVTRVNGYKGYITDIGGPTANMYGIECASKIKVGKCSNKRCLFPAVCPSLKVDHSRQIELLKRIGKVNGLKKVFVASGIRYDMVMEDGKHGRDYISAIAGNHVSGQLKVAPEHCEPAVLRLMGKPGAGALKEFKKNFDAESGKAGRGQFMTYYFIAAHPGCTEMDMKKARDFAEKELKTRPEQVQVFTPTPSTYSTLMYYTGVDPFSGKPIFVEKGLRGKSIQKEVLVPKRSKTGRSR